MEPWILMPADVPHGSTWGDWSQSQHGTSIFRFEEDRGVHDEPRADLGGSFGGIDLPRPPQYPDVPFYPAPSLAAAYPSISYDINHSVLPPESYFPRLFHQSALHHQPSNDSADTVRNVHHVLSQPLATESSQAASDQPFGPINPEVPQPYVKPETASTTAASSSDATSVLPAITSPHTTATGQGQAPFGQPTINANASPFQPPKPDAPLQPRLSKRKREEGNKEENGQDKVTQAPDERRLKKRGGRPKGRPRLTEIVGEASAVERRRIQIRVAQRAYRDRKDQTITRLEGEVKRLKKIKDGLFQGVIDILKLIRSHNVSNLPQVGPEFGLRVEGISKMIVRLNAGEVISQSADHLVSPDSRLDLSTSTGDGEVRTASPESTAIKVSSTSSTKQPASKSAITRNTKNKIRQQTLKTPPRIEPIAHSSQHYVPHPDFTSGVNTNYGHSHISRLLETDRPQTAFQRRLKKCLTGRRKGADEAEGAKYSGPLTSRHLHSLIRRPRALSATPHHAGEQKLTQPPHPTTTISLEDRQGPVASFTYHSKVARTTSAVHAGSTIPMYWFAPA